MEHRKNYTCESPEPSTIPVGDTLIYSMGNRSIDEIEIGLARMSEQRSCEVVVDWLNLTALLVSRVKTIRRNLEQIAVEWIEIHGPIDMGEIRYIVGHPKSVTCMDVVQCTHAVLDACGGELDALCSYLCSDPYKYGAVHRLIGNELFAQLFREERHPKLVEGKPQPQLIRVDQRFVR